MFCKNKTNFIKTLGTHQFFTASVVWGAIGAPRMFGPSHIYNALEWGFLVGALAPIPFYLLARKYPQSWLRYVHVPLILNGIILLCPYNVSYTTPCVLVGFIFNYYIKRHYSPWWRKYAYVMTSSFSVGIAVSAIVIFFSVQYKGTNLSWWGNLISYAGCDGHGCTRLRIP